MKKQGVKVLFLYTELAGYFMSCVNELIKQGAEVHIVRWPVNPEAPFVFEPVSGLSIYERGNYDLHSLKILAEQINPDIILCSGWIDKDYLKICKAFKKRISTVLLLDNQWRGDWKQKLASLASFIFISPYFSKAWVAGNSQYIFAQKLGFKSENISKGFYSADTKIFQNCYESSLASKEKSYPKRLLYLGRYVDFKGLELLWEVFSKAKKNKGIDWELWCIGTGELWEKRHENHGIKHIGFVQPNELCSYLSQCGVFVLPSLKEPWGVVVQEMAAAGFPLLLSNKVGAASAYLEEGKNGYSFEAGNADDLHEKLDKIFQMSDQELIEMGKNSHRLAIGQNPEVWSQTLLALI